MHEEDKRDSRVKRTFTDRSFRHYTTLGCIDPPEKDGRRSVYGFRHLVQALVVRRLLWDRVYNSAAGTVTGAPGSGQFFELPAVYPFDGHPPSKAL